MSLLLKSTRCFSLRTPAKQSKGQPYLLILGHDTRNETPVFSDIRSRRICFLLNLTVYFEDKDPLLYSIQTPKQRREREK
jgi:hypothetical protein